MSDLRFNMIAGSVLGAALGMMALHELSYYTFKAKYPEKAGMAVEIADTGGGGAQAQVELPPDWGRLLADPATLPSLIERGDKLHAACAACHTVEQGGATKQGPNLWGIVGRQAAGVPGFAYSEAMVAYGKPWTYDGLYNFLKAPTTYIKGTKMSYAGLRKQEDRVALVAYLRSLSSSPAPLPAPLPEAAPAEAAPAEGAAPVEGAPTEGAATPAAAPAAPEAAPTKTP
jgi:cytochrome c